MGRILSLSQMSSLISPGSHFPRNAVNNIFLWSKGRNTYIYLGSLTSLIAGFKGLGIWGTNSPSPKSNKAPLILLTELALNKA